MPFQSVPLKEGYIKDFATGKPVNIRKPEESVRQEFEKFLHYDLGYDLNQIGIEFPIQRGSKTVRGNDDYADIVIFKTTNMKMRDQHRDVMGIVETKRPNRKSGLRQLMSYMSASSCEWGVWTNGEKGEIEYLYKDPKTGEIKTEFIFQIPRKGETVLEMGRINKADLSPARDLKLIFNRILNTLYANTNISRREKLGSEMIRLIFCKIWDEKFDLDKPPKFRVGYGENPETVKTRVESLFKEARDELSGDGVFDPSEKLNLEPKSLMWVVGQLQRISLLKTEKDVVGDAFEVFAESKLVGEKGEFFTPREIVKTAVDLIDPQPGQNILDPACGSGGFLIYSLEYVWDQMEISPRYRNSPELQKLKQEVAERHFKGIDKEIDLVKIAKAYMAIVGDGRGGIVQENSLHRPNEYRGRAKDLFVENGTFKQHDIIFTNPPFGSKIKVLKEEAEDYELGHSWRKIGDHYEKTKKAKDTEPQILFVERCFQMLKDGGKLAIVLPETFFHAPNSKYIMQYIKNGNNIKAVVDLPHNTFRPHNNAKTILLILEKNRPQQSDIIMAVAEEMGHDHLGRILYRFDENNNSFTNEIWDDTVYIREELKDPYNTDNQYVFVVNKNQIVDNIFVPRYYWPKYEKDLREQAKQEGINFVQLGQLVSEGILETFSGHGSPPSRFKGKGEVPYIRVADIVNWEIYKNPTSQVPRGVYEKVKGSGIDLKEGDILFVRRGSYRIGSVAMVSPFDTEVLLTREFVILRVNKIPNDYDIDPYYLVYLLSHELTQKQIEQKVLIETTLPNIGDRWRELLLPLHKDRTKRKEISKKIKEAFSGKWDAQRQIIDLQNEYGNLTT